MTKKTHKTIEETIAEVQRKDKRYNYMILVVGLLLIMLVASMIFYGQYRKKMQAIEHQQLELETKERELIALELKAKESNQDSILNLVKSIQSEITKIRINSDNLSKEQLLVKLDVAQNKLEKISYKVDEKTIVQYYQCKGDGNKVINAIEKMDNFNLSVRKPNENYPSAAGSNTIWYGKNVTKKEVNQLVEDLKSQRVTIKNIIPIPDTKKNIPRQNTIGVGYKYTPNTKALDEVKVEVEVDPVKVRSVKLNNRYTIRFYSYKPDIKTKNSLLTFFKKANYNVKNYPDWKTRPSFFAKTPTIFYYSDKTKRQAYIIKDQLLKKGGIKFNVERGRGLGVEKNEMDNTFLIHYMAQ